MAKQASIQLKNLTKEYVTHEGTGTFLAVDHINVDIASGQFVTLLGPSGCGKTTTLRMIAGFEGISDGEILLDGVRINELTPDKRDSSMVFQSYALFPHYDVYDNVGYGLVNKKMDKKTIEEKVMKMLDLVGLKGMEHRMPNQLSGGQQQRVALARALVMEPAVLLFDEPLSNLDAKLRVYMRTEIRKIQQRIGITSVYVTHDQSEAMAQGHHHERRQDRAGWQPHGNLSVSGQPLCGGLHRQRQLCAGQGEERQQPGHPAGKQGGPRHGDRYRGSGNVRPGIHRQVHSGRAGCRRYGGSGDSSGGYRTGG